MRLLVSAAIWCSEALKVPTSVSHASSSQARQENSILTLWHLLSWRIMPRMIKTVLFVFAAFITTSIPSLAQDLNAGIGITSMASAISPDSNRGLGVRVTVNPNSPIWKAGVRDQYIITKIGKNWDLSNMSSECVDNLQIALSQYKNGETVRLVILNEQTDKTQNISVVASNNFSDTRSKKNALNDAKSPLNISKIGLGIGITSMTVATAPEGNGLGVRVRVRRDSPIWKAGVRNSDIIRRIGANWNLIGLPGCVDKLQKGLSRYKSGEIVNLVIYNEKTEKAWVISVPFQEYNP